MKFNLNQIIVTDKELSMNWLITAMKDRELN